MNTHELANLLLSQPDVPFSVASEICSGLKDKHGDSIYTTVDSHGVIDVIFPQDHPYSEPNECIIHLETTTGRDSGGDAVEAYKKVVKEKLCK